MGIKELGQIQDVLDKWRAWSDSGMSWIKKMGTKTMTDSGMSWIKRDGDKRAWAVCHGDKRAWSEVCLGLREMEINGHGLIQECLGSREMGTNDHGQIQACLG